MYVSDISVVFPDSVVTLGNVSIHLWAHTVIISTLRETDVEKGLHLINAMPFLSNLCQNYAEKTLKPCPLTFSNLHVRII
jgi:hypothetical protein